MRNLTKLIFSLILLGGVSLSAHSGNTLFGITPSETSLTLPSNGSANVMYTVTNNANTNATPSVIVGYQSSGNNLTLSSNTCNVSLSPGASCTFRVLISGVNQPERFTITPKVCGFDGFICSTTDTAVTVTIVTPAPGLVTRAYEEIVDNNELTTTLLGININNTSDVISYNLSFTDVINSVVISPDGSKVYATQHDGGGSSVAFFDVTSDSLILTQVVHIPEVFLHISPAPNNMQMAITPDGSALFITRYSGIGLLPLNKTFIPSASFFRIDLTSDSSTVTTITDPDSVLTSPRGLVISPDSKTVYVGTDANYIVALPVNADTVHTSNKIAEGSIPEDNHIGMAIDSAGNKLYVANETEGSVSIITVNGTQAHFEETILNSSEFSGASGLVVSLDGETLYVAETDNDSVLAVPLNTPDSPLVQPSIAGAFGLSLSPNGSLLYVAQADDFANTTTIINTENFLASPSILFIGDPSLTIGKFIGP